MRWSSSREKLRNGRLPRTVAPSTGCGGVGLWQPNLKEIKNRFDLAMFVKFVEQSVRQRERGFSHELKDAAVHPQITVGLLLLRFRLGVSDPLFKGRQERGTVRCLDGAVAFHDPLRQAECAWRSGGSSVLRRFPAHGKMEYCELYAAFRRVPRFGDIV